MRLLKRRPPTSRAPRQLPSPTASTPAALERARDRIDWWQGVDDRWLARLLPGLHTRRTRERVLQLEALARLGEARKQIHTLVMAYRLGGCDRDRLITEAGFAFVWATSCRRPRISEMLGEFLWATEVAYNERPQNASRSTDEHPERTQAAREGLPTSVCTPGCHVKSAEGDVYHAKDCAARTIGANPPEQWREPTAFVSTGRAYADGEPEHKGVPMSEAHAIKQREPQLDYDPESERHYYVLEPNAQGSHGCANPGCPLYQVPEDNAGPNRLPIVCDVNCWDEFLCFERGGNGDQQSYYAKKAPPVDADTDDLVGKEGYNT